MARVLIADDEPVMRELIEVTLEDTGHAVESVESGRA
jgi:CheY-like chemotaxis protein